jgi:hypothetical protein
MRFAEIHTTAHLFHERQLRGVFIKISDDGGNTMADYLKEIKKEEIVTIDKVFIGFLVGIVAVLSMWFLSGMFYVILK